MKDYIKRKTLLGNEVIGFADGDYRLERCERADIEPLIVANHYSHTMPKNAAYCF